ncbi:complex I subunit 5 family protein [Fervidicoccus fontis]|uniref:Membrane-bound oxidoreductase, subunit MbxH n=1 Tax=Fervidicoccus fontis (strain DSM 19380 / JCM 18336 / VKM B-2539 / Kam940) TaxID=1163730 RepID=I0A2Y7_FERFK|nr:complex I subunit 5 family protein [Fervidicoccus fontis]AFH43344.1 Membrane-bound oxidoreductase, subunit MbxH [Fervidicoccus fontis Kam940]
MIQNLHLILLSVVLPIVLLALMVKLTKSEKGVYSSTISMYVLATILSLVPVALNGFTSTYYDGSFLSANYIGVFDFQVNIITYPIAITVLVLSMLTAYYSYPYMTGRLRAEGRETKTELSIFYFLLFMFTLSIYASILSTNLLEFYLFLEISLITSFILVNNYGYNDKRKVSLIYLVWTHVGAVLFLVGSLILGIYAATFDVYSGYASLKNIAQYIPSSVLAWSFYLIMIGLLVKSASFGFHLWLPYAYAEAPTPVSMAMSALFTGIAPYAIFRFVIPVFPSMFASFSKYLALWAAVSMIYGGLNALYESDFRRFLSYSSISQMGYLLLAVSTNSIYGYVGLLLHYISHAFGKELLFGSSGSMMLSLDGARDMRKMGGFSKVMPITANMALIGFFSISGMPPTIGFWSELFILRGAVDAFWEMGEFGATVLALIFIGFSLTIAYSFYNYKRVFHGPYLNEKRDVRENMTIVLSLIIVSLLAILMFIIAPAYSNALITFIGGVSAQ